MSGAVRAPRFAAGLLAAIFVAAIWVPDVFSYLAMAVMALLLYPLFRPMYEFWVRRWLREKSSGGGWNTDSAR